MKSDDEIVNCVRCKNSPIMFSRFCVGVSASSVFAFSVDVDSFTGSSYESCTRRVKNPKNKICLVVIELFSTVSLVSNGVSDVQLLSSNFGCVFIYYSCTFYHKHESVTNNFKELCEFVNKVHISCKLKTPRSCLPLWMKICWNCCEIFLFSVVRLF